MATKYIGPPLTRVTNSARLNEHLRTSLFRDAPRSKVPVAGSRGRDLTLVRVGEPRGDL